MEGDTENSIVHGWRNEEIDSLRRKSRRKIKEKLFKRRNWLIHNVKVILILLLKRLSHLIAMSKSAPNVKYRFGSHFDIFVNWSIILSTRKESRMLWKVLIGVDRQLKFVFWHCSVKEDLTNIFELLLVATLLIIKVHWYINYSGIQNFWSFIKWSCMNESELNFITLTLFPAYASKLQWQCISTVIVGIKGTLRWIQ